MKAAVFDLDDTLYEDRKFVLSGFRAGAEYIGAKFRLDKKEIYKECVDVFENKGRTKVFDSVLKKNRIFSPALLKRLISIYQNHSPSIAPYRGAEKTLSGLRKKGMRLGIISDGKTSIQRNKVKALGIRGFFDIIIFTDDYGRRSWKPSLFAYKKIINFFKIEPGQIAYVGDNPNKDFLAANKLGMITIRLVKGFYKNVDLPYPQDAKFYINKITDILRYIK